MCRGKTFLLTAVILIMASVANAGLVLTVNGLDTSMPIEVKADDDIIIAVAGQTDEQKESYSVTCEMGGKLEPLPEPNTLAEKPKEGDYLFTFEDEELGLAMVNLTVGDLLDYQLILFKIPDANTIIFGIDSDAVQTEPEPSKVSDVNEPEPKPNDFDFMWPRPAMTYIERKAQEKAEHLISCPNNIDGFPTPDFNRANLGSLSFPSKDSRRLKRTLTISCDGDDGGVIMMGMDGVIDVNSDITSNQIWTADNTYHVLGDISVQALLVIEPNTFVVFAPDKSMSVNNGGTLISVGTADNPIIYTSDSSTPGFADYYCPMYIEETASVSTKVAYSHIEYAYAGIVVLNKRLDTSIENNYFYNNVYGIVEQGIEHTDISNNLIFASYHSGIEVFLADVNGQASSDSFILIENNTCDYYQDNGITVHGVDDVNESGVVVLANNIVSGSYQYGLALVDYYMYATVTNTGYFDNANNKNWEFEEENPAFETVLPYETGTGTLPVCYLRQDCNFIDAGVGFVGETGVVGLTTDVNGVPDSNITDIGVHYCHWDYTNTGEGDFNAGDLNHDWHTDFKDFAILANGWQMTYYINDLAALAGTWLQYGGPTPNIVPSFDQDPNNVSGGLTMTISVPDPNIHRVFVMLDGERYGEFGDLFESSILTMETEPHLNGTHSIKIIYLYDDVVICSQPVQVTFNNNISVFRGSDSFTPGEDYYLYGLGSGTYRVQVEDIVNENIVYSQTFTDNLEVHIDANSFPEEYGLYELDVDQQTLLLDITWKDIVEIVIGRKFKKEDFPHDSPVKMVISIGDKKLEKSKVKCWRACVKAAVRKFILPVFLNAKACTWENLSHCLSLDNVKMWYHCSHGHHDLRGQPPRQCINTASGWVFSYLKKDFDPNNIPPNYRKLWWFYEDNHSIAELGLKGSDKMIWVQFNACHSAHTTEFPQMLGIWPIKDPLMIGEQLFVGWKGTALVSDILGKYNQFEEDYWDYLRQGYTLKDAVDYALPPAGGTRILENFMYYGVVDWQYARFRYPDIN